MKTTVIILAAGQGTRLHPYTDDRPKCLVTLGKKSLIDHQAQSLRECALHDILVVGGYRADQLQSRGFKTILNPHFASTNMVSSLMCAASLFNGDSDLLITYGDIVFEPKIIASLLACEAPLATTIDLNWRQLWSLRSEDPIQDAETLRLDSSGNIVELGKRPKHLDEIEGQYMGLIKVSASFAPEWERVHRELNPPPNLFMTSFLQHLIDTGHPLRAVPVSGGWLEVDTAEDLEKYQQMYEEGTLKKYCHLS